MIRLCATFELGTMKRFLQLIIMCVLVLPEFRCAADPLDNWVRRNPLPTGQNLSGVTYGNGLFVAVEANGWVVTSPDGINWTEQSRGLRGVALAAVAYGNGSFVGIGDVITVSHDGVAWTNVWTDSNAGSTYAFGLHALTYGNGVFVALSRYSIATSEDSFAHWVSRSSGTQDYLSAIAFGNGLFVAVGKLAGTILTSTNGTNWNNQGSMTNTLSVIAYGNGRFVAGGYAYNGNTNVVTFFTSTNGTNWTKSTPVAGRVSSITFGNGQFVAVGDTATFTSSDGVNWNSGNLPTHLSMNSFSSAA